MDTSAIDSRSVLIRISPMLRTRYPYCTVLKLFILTFVHDDDDDGMAWCSRGCTECTECLVSRHSASHSHGHCTLVRICRYIPVPWVLYLKLMMLIRYDAWERRQQSLPNKSTNCQIVKLSNCQLKVACVISLHGPRRRERRNTKRKKKEKKKKAILGITPRIASTYSVL